MILKINAGTEMTNKTLWFDNVNDIDLNDKKSTKVELNGTFTKSELLKIIEVMEDE